MEKKNKKQQMYECFYEMLGNVAFEGIKQNTRTFFEETVLTQAELEEPNLRFFQSMKSGVRNQIARQYHLQKAELDSMVPYIEDLILSIQLDNEGNQVINILYMSLLKMMAEEHNLSLNLVYNNSDHDFAQIFIKKQELQKKEVATQKKKINS